MARIMKTVALISLLLTLLWTAMHLFLKGNIFLPLAITCGTVFYHFAMRLLAGTCIDKIMHNKANYNARWFLTRKWERKVYAFLRVQDWKGLLPTYDPSLFSLKDRNFDRLCQVMCQAEVVHEVIMVLSFLPLCMVPLFGAWPVFLITSLLSALFDSLFVMLQRHNRVIIRRLALRQKERERAAQEKETEAEKTASLNA